MAKQTFTTGQVLTAAQMTSLQQTAMGGGSATAKTASYTLVAADAGATVIMNSASATTITVNTSLFSAGDTVFLQNIGAGVCTVTAGTATVNTASSLALAQYESGNLYFTAAGTSIFSKADGAAGASGLTLIDEVSYSSATTINVNNVFSATYNNYKILNTATAGTAASFSFKLRVSGTDTSADYYTQLVYGDNTTAAGSRNPLGTDEIFYADVDSNSGSAFDILNPFLSAQTVMTGLAGYNNGVVRMIFGSQNTTTSFTGFTLLCGTAATGKVSVYGYAKE